MNSNRAIVAGSLSMAAAIGLGAFGAHSLGNQLLQLDTLDLWHTAVRYQVWHALGLILLGCYTVSPSCRGVGRMVGWMFLVGSVLFSGSLYALALDPSAVWLGPVTPLGGLCLMLGWVRFGWISTQRSRLERLT